VTPIRTKLQQFLVGVFFGFREDKHADTLGAPVVFHHKALSPYSCYEVTF